MGGPGAATASAEYLMAATAATTMRRERQAICAEARAVVAVRIAGGAATASLYHIYVDL